MALFACRHNSDQTEGRGRDVDFDWTDNLEDAVKRVQGHGGMGYGVGSVQYVEIITDLEEIRKNGGPLKRTHVYGPSWEGGRGGRGTYATGWDPRGVDPEWPELQRLAAKFGVEVVDKR